MNLHLLQGRPLGPELMKLTKISERRSLFKYFSAVGAIGTLKSAELRLTSPRKFNDPFDTSFRFRPGISESDLRKLAVEAIIDGVRGRLEAPRAFSKYSSLLPLLREKLKHLSDAELTEVILQRESQIPANLDKMMSGINEAVLPMLDDIFVYCLTDKCDDLLMWAHYASAHTGMVVEFEVLPEQDNIF